MGFFNFWRKGKKETVKPQLKSLPAHPVEPIEPIEPKKPIEVKPVKNDRPTPLPALCDLFRINICNIFKYEPKLIEETTAGGKPVKKYSLKLPELELSTFYKAEIIQHNDGTYDLVLQSNVNEIRKGLADFIDFCTREYGPDFMHKGSVADSDYRDVPLGVFSRIWYNKLRIENTYFTISLTIYNVA